MKKILRETLSVTPIAVVIGIVAYVIVELLEDTVSEASSDFVYPLAFLVVFLILWYRVVPVIKSEYLDKEDTKSID